MENITIRVVTENDILAVQTFLLDQLASLFEQENGQDAITDDVCGLREMYIRPERHEIWAAFDQDGCVIGTIAISQYNDRIEVVKGRYQIEKTAEIGRCYLKPNQRRKGIGSKLLIHAEAFCKQKKYQFIYLHTHHFLPGGYQFWQKNGFSIVADEGGVYEIVHMEKKL